MQLQTSLRDDARNYYTHLIENYQWESHNKLTHDIRWCKNRSEHEHRHVYISPVSLQCIYLDESRLNSKASLFINQSIPWGYEDFLKTDFPQPQSDLILSGGEPLLHPNFVEACNIVRKLNGHITMSTNGILYPNTSISSIKTMEYR